MDATGNGSVCGESEWATSGCITARSCDALFRLATSLAMEMTRSARAGMVMAATLPRTDGLVRKARMSNSASVPVADP